MTPIKSPPYSIGIDPYRRIEPTNKYSYLLRDEDIVGSVYNDSRVGWVIIVSVMHNLDSTTSIYYKLSKWWLIRKYQVWNFNRKRNYESKRVS